MEVTISFEDKRVCTTVNVKIQAPDSLLLSEVICQELGIVKYHPSVKSLDKQSPLSENPKHKVRLIRTAKIASHSAVMPQWRQVVRKVCYF